MGGVQTGEDAGDLITAGADLVAVGTESFRDPAAALRIAAELSQLVSNTLQTQPIVATILDNARPQPEVESNSGDLS